MRETQRGTVSSNSRFQTILVQQYSANLSGRPLAVRPTLVLRRLRAARHPAGTPGGPSGGLGSRTRERGSAPEGCRHSTQLFDPQ